MQGKGKIFSDVSTVQDIVAFNVQDIVAFKIQLWIHRIGSGKIAAFSRIKLICRRGSY